MDNLSPDTVETIRLILALLTPLAVGVMTKYRSKAAFKAMMLTVISALNTAFTELLSSADANLNNIFRRFVFTAVVAIATYFGIWKPTGVGEKVRKATKNIGLGKEPLETTWTGERIEFPDKVVRGEMISTPTASGLPRTSFPPTAEDSLLVSQPITPQDAVHYKTPKRVTEEQGADPESPAEEEALQTYINREVEKGRRKRGAK